MEYEKKFQIDNLLQSIDILAKEVNSVSDRSCAIVCAAFLDDFLERLILSFLSAESSTQDKLLIGNNGPLSTFSAKIVIAYRLGLISKQEYEKLTLIRKIRNEFAHDIKINSFDEDKIKSILLNHVPDERLLPPISIPLTLNDEGRPLEIPIGFFIQYASDENLYSEIVDKFPEIKFRELDKNNPRSIFLSIVYILHACLNSRLLFALINQRKSLKEFNDIVEIEGYRTEYFNNKIEEHRNELLNMKRKVLDDLTELEKKLSTNQLEIDLLKKNKEEFLKILGEIDKSISKLNENPITIEHAMQNHTYWLLKYQMSQRNLSEKK